MRYELNEEEKKRVKVALANALVEVADYTCGGKRLPHCTDGICEQVRYSIIRWCEKNLRNTESDHWLPGQWEYCTFVRAWLRRNISDWPEHSGYPDYPVPAPKNYVPRESSLSTWVDSGVVVDAGAMARMAFYDLPRWEYDEYGAARRRLLAFLLERIAEEL